MALVSLVVVVLSAAGVEPDQPWERRSQAAGELRSQARYEEAAAEYTAAMELARKSGDHRAVVTLLNNLAAMRHQQWRFAEAEALYRSALESGEPVLGPNDVLAGALLHNLGELLKTTGRLAEAEPLLERALAAKRARAGDRRPDVAVTLVSLGDLYRRQGRLEDAGRVAREGVELLENTPTASLAHGLNLLGLICHTQGQLNRAEQFYRRAGVIWEKAAGPRHPDVGVALNNLGSLYREQGRYLDAVRMTRRALAIWEQTLGPEHPKLAGALANLADQESHLGRLAEAEMHAARALAITEATSGARHLGLVAPLLQLAEAARKRGRLADAEKLYRRALDLLEHAHGRNGRLTAEEQPVPEGRERSSRSLEGADEPEPLLVASVMNGLGVVAFERADLRGAEARFLAAWAKTEERLGASHANLATPMVNLAAVYVTAARYGEAEPLLIRSLELRERQLGADHPLVAATLLHYSILLRQTGRGREAGKLEARATAILRRHGEENLQRHSVDAREILALRPKR